MPFQATVFRVLIASPSDVSMERCAVAESLYEWNAMHSASTGKVLLPVRWESHTAPIMRGRPQKIINDQIVESCDMLIGLFWTRLGSHTGIEESGTIEEIKLLLGAEKPVMLYYSKAPIPPDDIDTIQLDKLKKFRESIRNQGLQENYNSVRELKDKLSRQLTIIVREMLCRATAANASCFDSRAPAEASTKSPVLLASSRMGHGEVGKIWLAEFNEESFVVLGYTSPRSSELKKMRGRFVALGNRRVGWVFPRLRLGEIATMLGLPSILSSDG